MYILSIHLLMFTQKIHWPIFFRSIFLDFHFNIFIWTPRSFLCQSLLQSIISLTNMAASNRTSFTNFQFFPSTHKLLNFQMFSLKTQIFFKHRWINRFLWFSCFLFLFCFKSVTFEISGMRVQISVCVCVVMFACYPQCQILNAHKSNRPIKYASFLHTHEFEINWTQ